MLFLLNTHNQHQISTMQRDFVRAYNGFGFVISDSYLLFMAFWVLVLSQNPIEALLPATETETSEFSLTVLFCFASSPSHSSSTSFSPLKSYTIPWFCKCLMFECWV